MATSYSGDTPREQLTGFTDAFVRTFLTVALSLVLASVVFIPALSVLGVFDLAQQWVSGRMMAGYLLASSLGFTLYLSADYQRGKASDTEAEGVSDDEEVEPPSNLEQFKQAVHQMYKGWAMISFLFILVSTGAIAAAVTATYVSVAFAPVVAVVYPVADYKLYQKVHAVVSPASVLFLISHVLILPTVAIISLAAALLGSVLGVFAVLLTIPIQILRALYDVFRVSGFDSEVIGPVDDLKHQIRHSK